MERNPKKGGRMSLALAFCLGVVSRNGSAAPAEPEFMDWPTNPLRDPPGTNAGGSPWIL